MFSAGEAEHRLVKGSKSPTELDIPDNLDIYEPIEKKYSNETGEHNQDIDQVFYEWAEPGKFIQVKHEEWSDTYTATAIIQQRKQDAPPVQCGDRWTEKLTKAAQRKIDKSARYLSKSKRGYRAFITLTFNNEQRRLIELHDKPGAFDIGQQCGPVINKRTSISKEASRFLNALQQRRKEGMLIDVDGNKKMLRGTGKLFDYVWVIENPWHATLACTLEGAQYCEIDGLHHRNPHIHLLTNWTVKRKHFKGWAARIEKLWGHGFAHIEKIKKPASAAAYMAKAAGYIGKGADGSQGPVRGNRYNISKGARAPAPRMIGNYALQFLRDAIALGNRLGRKAWPEGLYFHEHGFGSKGRAPWVALWQTLKADGFKFITAADFFVDSMEKTFKKHITDNIPRRFNEDSQQTYLDSMRNFYARYEPVTH